MGLPTGVFCNGTRIAPEAATLSVLGSTIYGAFGVYESIQLWNGCCFHLDAHLERLLASARGIGLPLAGDLPMHRGWVLAAVEAEGVEAATIRLFAVGPEQDSPPRSFIWLEPVRAPSARQRRAGVGAVTYPGERALPHVKSLNTLVNTLARQAAQAAGVYEGLLRDRNDCITEGASSNFYAVAEGVLLLPPPEEILEGVTLQLVLEMAQAAGIPVARQRLPRADIPRWAEAFVTSTSRHILPVVGIDGIPVAAGRPGPVTGALHRRFEERFAAETGAAYG